MAKKRKNLHQKQRQKSRMKNCLTELVRLLGTLSQKRDKPEKLQAPPIQSKDKNFEEKIEPEKQKLVPPYKGIVLPVVCQNEQEDADYKKDSPKDDRKLDKEHKYSNEFKKIPEEFIKWGPNEMRPSTDFVYSGKEIFLKRIKVSNDNQIRDTLMEICITRNLGKLSDNFPKVLEIEYNKSNVDCEPCKLTSIDIFMKKEGSDLTNLEKTDDLINIIFQMINAFCFMGTLGIFHCDIKPENMLKSEGKVIIIDFGSAITFYRNPQKLNKKIGKYYAKSIKSYTKKFAPPEMLEATISGKEINREKKANIIPMKYDVFSLGLTMLSLLLKSLGEHYEIIKYDYENREFDEIGHAEFLKQMDSKLEMKVNDNMLKLEEKNAWKKFLWPCLEFHAEMRPTFEKLKCNYTELLKSIGKECPKGKDLESAEIIKEIGDSFYLICQLRIAEWYYNKYVQSGKNGEEKATVLIKLGEIKHIFGDYEGAKEYYKKAENMSSNKVQKAYTHVLYLNTKFSLEPKKEIAKEMKGLIDKIDKKSNFIYVHTVACLAQVYNALNEFAEAEKVIFESTILNYLKNNNDIYCARIYNQMGLLYTGKMSENMDLYYKSAKKQFKEAITTCIRITGNEGLKACPYLAILYKNLALLYEKNNEVDRAIKNQESSKNIHLLAFGEDHHTLAFTYCELARLNCVKNPKADTKAKLNEAKKIIKRYRNEYSNFYPAMAELRRKLKNY